jgi:hypothetical protein
MWWKFGERASFLSSAMQSLIITLILLQQFVQWCSVPTRQYI